MVITVSFIEGDFVGLFNFLGFITFHKVRIGIRRVPWWFAGVVTVFAFSLVIIENRMLSMSVLAVAKFSSNVADQYFRQLACLA